MTQDFVYCYLSPLNNGMDNSDDDDEYNAKDNNSSNNKMKCSLLP